jgi:VTC domain
VRAIEALEAISLDDVVSQAALQDRVDVKYLVRVNDFAQLVERLGASHAVLERDGSRAFRYRTTYFDTADLETYRAHAQRRRRRYKCRTREYVESGLVAFEVKLKGPRGRTVKHRMPYERAWRDAVTDSALAFVRDTVRRTYGREPGGRLQPALAVAYTRITLVAPEQRLTCDFDLRFSAPDGASGRLAEGMVILESKSIGGGARADRVLRTLGARPVSVCSKYCLGVGFTRPGVKSNRLRPLLRRHFLPAPPAAVTLTTNWEDVP